MILISLLIRHLLKYRRHRLNRHHRHRIATNGIASLFIYRWLQSENIKKKIFYLNKDKDIDHRNKFRQPTKKKSDEREYSGE